MGPLEFYIHINDSIENFINWSVKGNTGPRLHACSDSWPTLMGRTIRPVFELAAHSIHTKLCYYPLRAPAPFRYSALF